MASTQPGIMASRSGTRVAIVEEDELLRAGMRAILAGRAMTVIVGEAGTVSDGIDLCRTTRPDVVLTSLTLPDAEGAAHIGHFRAVSPRSSVLVLSATEEPALVLAAIGAGAIGYMRKGRPAAELAVAIDRAMAGEEFVDPLVASRVIRWIAAQAEAAVGARRPPPLTTRELQVLKEVARGSANKEIARDLAIAAGTIKVHIERILGKLGAANRAEASMRAIQLGLLDPDAIDLDRAHSAGRG